MKYLLNSAFYTIAELEAHIPFKFLPSLSFESPSAKKEIQARGLAKLKNNQVSPESQALGEKFIPQIEASHLPNVSIRWIDDRIGYGLFAQEDLPTNTYAGEYTGTVRENNRRYFEPLNNYLYEYPVPDEIGRSFVIDATAGHLTRFINHSFKPNLKPYHVFHDGFYHLVFVTLRNISKGEELSYDYGQNYWLLRDRPV